MPLGRYQEQRSVVRAPEHASEAPAVEMDCLQHLPAFADAHATPVGHVCIPDGVFGVEADAVGDAVAEVGPHAPVRQAPVRGDVEGGEPFAVDSAMISVALSGVTAMPFGKAMPSATCRTGRSAVTSAMMPGPPLM
jgi:hypothetical protein